MSQVSENILNNVFVNKLWSPQYFVDFYKNKR
jgi:hypothetical protein